MNSRLSEVYNQRAAKQTMIPGDWYGIPVNKYEGGESVIVAPVRTTPVKTILTNMNFVPTTNKLASLSERVIDRYTTEPLEITKTFNGVLGADDLNSKFTKVKKSALPDVNFDIIASERYPEPPVLWETSIGKPSRLFDRPDGNRYTR